MTEIAYPLPGLRALGADDLARAEAVPLAQIIVTGRSGSMLVHSYLDGHPEIAHIPHTFKFYDFAAANPGLTARGVPEIVGRFVAAHAPLFDTRASNLLGGRLGEGMTSYVRLDATAYGSVVASLLGIAPFDHRRLFYALTIAYAHCVGQDIDRAKVILQHLHHGDWLWPEMLSDRFNVRKSRDGRPTTLLRADKLLVSLREPFETYLSASAFTAKLGLPQEQAVDALETYLRLLVQDWQRLARAELEYSVHVVRLEDLRVDSQGAMRACAAWLGVDPQEPSLEASTFYGLPWFGDSYSPASNTPRKDRPKGTVCWQDTALLETLVRPTARRYGYESANSCRWTRGSRLAAVALGFVAPPKALYGGRGASLGGYLSALRRVARRIPIACRVARARAVDEAK
jgi:hypothetical protein